MLPSELDIAADLERGTNFELGPFFNSSKKAGHPDRQWRAPE